MTEITDVEILSQHIEGTEARFHLRIPDTLIYFRGHFNEFPVLPGLTQIKWAIEFAQRLSGCSRIGQINRLKFSHLIVPDTTLMLAIDYQAEMRRADFRYYHDTITFSQGQLLYRD